MKNKPESQATITPFVTYATIEQLNDEASTRATNDAGILSNLNSFRTTTNNNLAIKQNISDSTLQTTIKTVPGAINELNTKATNQTTSITTLQGQVTNNGNNITTLQGQVASNTTSIGNNTSAINQNTNDITNLQTQVTTITSDITNIKSSMSDSNNQLNLKQNITDDTLETNNNTVSGAINELNTKKVNNADFSIFKDTMLQFQEFTNDALDQKQNIVELTLETANNTIPTAINELNGKVNAQGTSITNLQTQVTSNTTKITNNTNAINQITASVPIWTNVGTSTNPRTWTYSLVLNKKYRVAYNWNSNDATSKIYKEFVWTGNNISLETYIDGFIGITVINIQVLGSANVVEIAATTSGIVINTKVGISSIGRIISLEQSS